MHAGEGGGEWGWQADGEITAYSSLGWQCWTKRSPYALSLAQSTGLSKKKNSGEIFTFATRQPAAALWGKPVARQKHATKVPQPLVRATGDALPPTGAPRNKFYPSSDAPIVMQFPGREQRTRKAAGRRWGVFAP